MKQVLTPTESCAVRQRLFSKFRLVLLLGGFALLISSCHKEDSHCKKTVAYKAKFVVTSEVIKQGPPIQQQHLTAKGEGTPIGKATFEAYVDFDLSATPTSVNGKQTITTENGDQIFTTGKGYAIGLDANGDIKVVLNDIITGGTGKYAGATGSFGIVATASVKTPVGSDVEEGSITY